MRPCETWPSGASLVYNLVNPKFQPPVNLVMTFRAPSFAFHAWLSPHKNLFPPLPSNKTTSSLLSCFRICRLQVVLLWGHEGRQRFIWPAVRSEGQQRFLCFLPLLRQSCGNRPRWWVGTDQRATFQCHYLYVNYNLLHKVGIQIARLFSSLKAVEVVRLKSGTLRRKPKKVRSYKKTSLWRNEPACETNRVTNVKLYAEESCSKMADAFLWVQIETVGQNKMIYSNRKLRLIIYHFPKCDRFANQRTPCSSTWFSDSCKNIFNK